jgi:hypothetical protein
MKMLFTKKNLIILLVATGFCLTSCIDESADVDFDKAFDNIGVVDGAISGPLVKGITTNLGDLLKKVKSPTDAAEIGYLGTDSVIAIFYTHPEATKHEMPDINDDFGLFNQQMLEFKIANFLEDAQSIPDWILNIPGVSLTVPQGVEETYTQTVSFGNVQLDDNNHSKLDRIEFKNVKLKLNVNTTIAFQSNDFLQFSIVLPPDPNQPNSTAQTIPLKMNDIVSFSGTILCDAVKYASSDIELKVTVKGDNATQVTNSSTFQCSLEFDPSDGDFVAWGWFNYVLADATAQTGLKQEDLPANIQQYLSDGTVLIFDDPRLQFEVESQVGVPLQFVMTELVNKSKDGNEYPISNPYTFNIDQSGWDGNVEIAKKDTFEVSKTSFYQGTDSLQYRDMFRSNLDSLSLKYRVITNSVDLNNIGDKPIQHLSKSSKITVHAKATLPLILGDGSVLKYNETEEVDFSNVDVSIKEGTTDSVKIYLGYKNTLPLGMKATIEFLKEDEATIVKDFPDITLGTTPNPNEWSEIILAFDPTVVNQLKEIKYMRVKYSSDEVTDIAVFKASNAITLRLAVEATKITIGINDLNKENENQ